jgi:hypothetical protein
MKYVDSTYKWDDSDPRWRDCEYLDYVSYIPWVTMTSRPHLAGVTRVRFAPQQPEPFAEFAGRFADLGIRNLGLDFKQSWRLHFGLATTGLRVPGTCYVLRVARPWYAYFEERAGEFHALPENWMEFVRLVRCPGGGIEWLGRQHPMARYKGFDFSSFRETPRGWKCDSLPQRPRPAGILMHEISCVMVELHDFERTLLPAMAARAPEIFAENRLDAPADCHKEFHTLAEWQAAARWLFNSLAARAKAPLIYNAAQFRDFICGEPELTYDIHEGRIRYLMGRPGWDWRSAVRRLPEERQPQDPSNKDQVLAAMKEWVLGPLTSECDLWNALHGVLPAIAVNDLKFVRQFLNMRTWRERVLAGTVLTDEERRHEPGEVQAYLENFMGGVLKHVIWVLAANHFMHIGPFLNHPCFNAEEMRFLPHQLFEVLFAKTQVVTDLRLCIGYVTAPGEPEPTEANNDR